MVESIVTVVLEVVKCLAPPTERQISYLRNYDNNLVNLRNEIEKLKGNRESVQHKVDEAKGKGEEIENNVQTWLESVDKVVVKAETFVGDEDKASKRCFKGLCPNLKTRHRLSKEAAMQLETLVKLRGERGFDKISYSTAPDVLPLMSGKDYYAFESRMSTLNNILGSLRSPDINMLGIYGMGGIGKTTLAKEVARQARSEKLFDQVVFVEVSQSQDIRKIQGEIAEQLGPKLTKESEPGRASSLFKRMKEKKILVILDNIWDELKLLDVGIPYGDDHKGCKILLTARSEGTLLRKMGCLQNFSVSVLDEKEAWSLFQKTVGENIEGGELESVAKKVAKECEGLPISIVPVAKALRKKSLHQWKDALYKLRNPSTAEYEGIQGAAYSAIELSYDALEREELKKIFLLIVYANIENIDELLMCGMGLGLFQNINKMEGVRDRVHTLIEELKDSSLLLDEMLSMHDVVRDFATVIASKRENVLTLTNAEMVSRWESSDECAIKHYSSIVLFNVENIVLPEELNCSHLKLFYVRAAESSSTIPDNFFVRMKQIRVLVLKNMNLSSVPSSLGLITNLQTLCLYYCKLQDLVGIGDLKKLEILYLKGSEVEQLPVEIGQLTQLKLLDLRYCGKLKVIPPNILSNMSHLEELYIGDCSFNGWEEKVEGRKNASLDELKHLPNLTSLEISVKDVNSLPRGLFFEKLERYKIFIGNQWYRYGEGCRIFHLELKTNVCWKDELIVQLQGIEDLRLRELREQDVKNFINELVKMSSSQMKMKHLALHGCYAPNLRESKESIDDVISEDDVNVLYPFFMEKVVLPNLETLELSTISNIDRIWPNQVVAMSCDIQKLTRLILYDCRNLKYLFSSSIVISFVQLQHLEIENCPVLKEIIVMDQEKMKNITFPQLQVLKMKKLSKLTSFCSKDPHIEFPNLKELQIRDCPKFMVKYKITDQDSTKKKWKESTSKMQSNEIILEDDVNVPTSLFNEKTLQLYKLNIERIWLCPSSIISSFIQLENLEIEECLVLKGITVEGQKERNDVMFPQLKIIKIKNVPKFTRIFSRYMHVEFPSVKKLEISECPEFLEKYKSATDDLMKKHQVFPNLKVLGVEAKHMPWICQFPVFCRLVIVEFDESTTILSLDDFLQRLHNVKILNMWGDISRLIFQQSENGMTLNIRGVNKCCDLVHILKKESSILDNLEMLMIAKCENLISLVPSSTSFQNLTTLNVRNCKGLRNVLTTSTAKSLMRLRKMGIDGCNMITEIVADDEGDNAAKDEIVFSELKELVLSSLDSVTSFCSGVRAFKFPSLETLVVERCPNMKVFYEGELRTPKLHKVQRDYIDEECWIWGNDLNTSKQQLCLKRWNDLNTRIQQLHLKNKKVKEDLGQASMHHSE